MNKKKRGYSQKENAMNGLHVHNKSTGWKLKRTGPIVGRSDGSPSRHAKSGLHVHNKSIRWKLNGTGPRGKIK